MSGEDAENASAKKRSWTRRIASLAVGLAVSLVIGAIIERVSDKEWLASAKEAQAQWIEAVANTSPVGVASLYWTEVSGAYSHDVSGGSWSAAAGVDSWIFAPLIAFAMTIWRSFYEGGATILIQIGMGALAVGVFNLARTKRETFLFDPDFLTFQNVIFLPFAIMICASLIGMILWAVMMGALYALSWITGLAAAAAGATGIVGFCWLCAMKLGEKGAEHVMTPKL
jgi:hypothetical protein